MAVIKLLNKRLSFPNLWVPKSIVDQKTGQPGPPAYGCSFLIGPDDPQIDELEELFDREATRKWGDKAALYMREIRAKDRTPLHNGDFKADYDGYAGMYYVSARNAAKPLIVDKDPFVRDEQGAVILDPKTDKPLPNVLTEAHGRPYGGCYVNASLDIYAQDAYGNRINATLRGVQYVDDGDAFAGGPPASADEFDDLSAGGGAQALV